MNFDEFITGARQTVARYVNISMPILTEALLARELLMQDIEPMEVFRTPERWTMLAGTAMPDGRLYRVEYDCKNGAWSLTAYRREAARE